MAASNWRVGLDVLTSLVLIGAAAFVVTKRSASTARLPVAEVQPRVPSSPIRISAAASLGAPIAPWIVMVFSDFECPYCGRFARDVFPKIKAHYIDSGKLQLVFRHLPLTQLHPNAQIAAEMSECAASRGAFWRVHDALFALTASGGLDEKALAVVARGAGLSPQDLAA
jgi:protein-disulfide isomerase